MAVNNATILDRVRLVATNDYQQRIPPATQGSIASTMRALFDPLNREYWNQFIDILVNRIGMTIVRSDQWDNPLAAFKGARLINGSSIQEVAPQWIVAHSYDDADETLLKLARPEAAAWYHSQNRRDKYKLSINEQELRTAFTDGEFGINSFITKLMQVPYNSDAWDEYKIMLQLIAEYENNWGFYKQGLDAYNAQTFDAKAFNEELLTQIQAYAGILRFPSQLYNAQDVDIPVFANPDELILMITPKTLAGLNVQTLANVFNLDLAEIKYRTVIVDEFPIPNCDAILTTRDFFVCHDTLYQTDSFYDPNTLSNHYYLHHWGIYSVSPFVPAICFGNFETTGIGSIVYEQDSDPSFIYPLWAKINGMYDGELVTSWGDPETWDQYALKRALADLSGNNPQITEINYDPGTEVQFVMLQPGDVKKIVGSVIGASLPYIDDFTNVVGAGCKWSITPYVTRVPAGGDMPERIAEDWTNSATKIDMYGRLKLQKTLPKQAGTYYLTVTCEYSYTDPSSNDVISNTASIDIQFAVIS